MIRVDGLVRMATEVRPVLAVAAFECTACGETVYTDQLESRLVEPYTCPNNCNKARFRFLQGESAFEDAQRVHMQETQENLRGGNQPQTIDAVLYGELAGTAVPGEQIQLTGTLKARQQVFRSVRSTSFDLFVDVNHIEVLERNFADVTITPEDEGRIAELAADPEIHTKIAGVPR